MFLRRGVRILSRTHRLGFAGSRLASTAAHAAQGGTSDFQPYNPIYRRDHEYDAQDIAMVKKRKFDEFKGKFKAGKNRKPQALLPEGSNEEIIDIEVAELLSKVSLNGTNGHAEHEGLNLEGGKESSPEQPSFIKPAELGQQVELEIVQLSSTGDGLAYNDAKDHIFIVPFSLPGDRVLAKPWRWEGKHTISDFVKVIRPAPSREGVTPRCPYFSKCSGCQFQMLPYDKQLEHKRGILQNAFKDFSGLKSEQVPEVEPTMGSPLQYGYRTKLSPHFSGPSNYARKKKEVKWETPPKIGFNVKGTRAVMDIESCPIGADILQEGLKIERKSVLDNLDKYKQGATILLRESTQREYKDDSSTNSLPSDTTQQNLKSSTFTTDKDANHPAITLAYPTHIDTKTYISDNRAQVTEYITTTTDATATPPKTLTYKFTNTAGSFFQNNNSILGPFTSYIYEHSIPANSNINYLLDAYSGSGLFTLTLSSHFTSSLGIDIDTRGIEAARLNAAANNVTNAGFIDADASALFADVPYPPEQTLVIIDPPRKGCDREFLRQLRTFGPRRVVYVSCNVHSQARDVGILVNGFRRSLSGRYSGNVEDELDEKWESEKLWKYEIESLRGFDFFPQTGHVEGVCVLNRVERPATSEVADAGPSVVRRMKI